MQFEIDTLLKDVSFNIGTLREAKRRFSDQLAPEFSIFDYTRSDEMALSNCLAGLLDPQGKHGQGSLFLREFIKNLCPDTTWIRNYERCEVNTEKQANGQRRIDVHLGFEEGVIGIENKPWAGDQNRQLFDYAKYLEQSATGKQWLLIYLCNDEPSDESIPKTTRESLVQSGNYVSFNYSQLVEWLEVCHAKTKAVNVRIFIEEVVKFVRININGELEMSEENETCRTVLASKKNLESALDISKAMNSVKQTLLKKFRNNLEDKLHANGFQLIWDMDNNWKPCAGFGVKFLKQQDLYLRFEFEKPDLNKLFWGIRRDNALTSNEASRWATVAELMTKQFGKGGMSPWWPWYSENTKELFNREVGNWGNPDFLWSEIVEQSGVHIVQTIAQIACRVQNIFTEDYFLLTNSPE